MSRFLRGSYSAICSGLGELTLRSKGVDPWLRGDLWKWHAQLCDDLGILEEPEGGLSPRSLLWALIV